MTSTNPEWAEQLRRRYLRGEASQFILHGNVHDVLLHDGRLYSVGDWLTKVFLPPSRKTICRYDLSTGVRFLKRDGDVANLETLMLEKDREKIFTELGIMLQTSQGAAVVLEYAEMLAPAGDTSFFVEADRRTVIGLHRWSLSRKIEVSDNLVILITENLSELNQKLVSNPSVVTIEVPMPDGAARRALIDHLVPDFEPDWRERLADVTAGLKSVQVRQILRPSDNEVDDPGAREGFIRGLLGSAKDAMERAKKLSELTKGMSHEEIKDLIAPHQDVDAVRVEDDGRDQILDLIYKRKREIIERECYGLIEFVEPDHDFSVVGGIDHVEEELRQIAKNMREGKTSRCPMGLLFTGPMGTGKTFVAEAFVKETGMTAVKLKNFRSKWVGATEANLEKILNVIKAMGQVIVIIDEGDRAFGADGDSDGGTSSRAIARIKQFMSDTTNRGRVLFILMTNRPDKLDIDLKRAGRLDTKIPFLYPQDAETVEAVLLAQCRKHDVATDVTFPTAREQVSAPLIGYSAAELEAVVLGALDVSKGDTVTGADFVEAIHDYLPSRDVKMLEFMELLAVFEASSRKMLPKKYADLGVEELSDRLDRLKLEVGNRR